MQKYDLQKNSLIETKILLRYFNSITNLKLYNTSQLIIFQKSSHMKIDLLLLLLPSRGQNPLSYYILYNESEHNILALVGKAKNKKQVVFGTHLSLSLSLRK
jgi:hypothetical protein